MKHDTIKSQLDIAEMYTILASKRHKREYRIEKNFRIRIYNCSSLQTI